MIRKPRCHGMVTVVSAQSPVCLSCPASASCVRHGAELLSAMPASPARGRAVQHLALVRQVLQVHASGVGQGRVDKPVMASTRGVLRVALDDATVEYLGTLPKRVAGPTETLMRRGWFTYARAELKSGRVPHGTGWKALLCRHILERRSRAEFQQALQSELGLSEGSAKVQACLALAIFRAGKLLSARDDQLMVSPD